MFSTILKSLRRGHLLLHRKYASDCDLLKSKSSFLERSGFKNPQVPLSSAELIFFYGPSFHNNVCCPVEKYQCVFSNQNFFNIKQTVLYIHGYQETPNFESIHVLVNAYTQRKDINFILLNWSALSDGNYIFDAVPNTKLFGPYMADILIDIFDRIVDIQRFHIVGHSLGAQLAGLIGREIYKKTKGCKKIKRISGLDPAFPLFYLGGIAHHLNKNDAEFVDIIHTDAWRYGFPFSTGHADFWPNGGRIAQPGHLCKRSIFDMMSEEDLISHQRSWWFWAESVSFKYPYNFEAVQAESWQDFKIGKLSPCHTKAEMGINCPFGVTGDFFLQTNGTPPFARGEAGTVYIDPNELPGNDGNQNKSP